MIAVYNEHVGDVLMLILADDKGQKVTAERRENVTKITAENGQIVAWNIFEAKNILSNLTGNGQIELTAEAVEKLNENLKTAGFDELLEFDNQPKFVVAEILEMEDIPDTHLHTCQVEVGFDQPVQIVCGAPNAKVGLKTVAALPGAMMPNGALIFAGSLRGVPSAGMLCAARELELPNAPQERGIIELSDVSAGQKFEKSMWK